MDFGVHLLVFLYREIARKQGRELEPGLQAGDLKDTLQCLTLAGLGPGGF